MTRTYKCKLLTLCGAVYIRDHWQPVTSVIVMTVDVMTDIAVQLAERLILHKSVRLVGAWLCLI